MHVADHHSLHGYITDIQQNYLSFYSPIYKTMYISTDHVKWLIPYVQTINPYGIANTLKAELVNKNCTEKYICRTNWQSKRYISHFKCWRPEGALGEDNRCG